MSQGSVTRTTAIHVVGGALPPSQAVRGGGTRGAVSNPQGWEAAGNRGSAQNSGSECFSGKSHLGLSSSFYR